MCLIHGYAYKDKDETVGVLNLNPVKQDYSMSESHHTLTVPTTHMYHMFISQCVHQFIQVWKRHR